MKYVFDSQFMDKMRHYTGVSALNAPFSIRYLGLDKCGFSFKCFTNVFVELMEKFMELWI